MIAAPVQCDVDGVPKGPHFARVPPTLDRITNPGDTTNDTLRLRPAAYWMFTARIPSFLVGASDWSTVGLTMPSINLKVIIME
jgi:hypothetical protein